MEPETQVEVIEDLEPDRAADILEEMSPDDAADLVADLSQTAREEILALMEKDEAEEVKELLGYPEDAAGGIMTTEYIALPANLTAAPGDRPAARAGARCRDDLLRLRRGPVGVARRRSVAARPDRGQARDAYFGGDDQGADHGQGARRPGPRRRCHCALQPARRARRRRRAAISRASSRSTTRWTPSRRGGPALASAPGGQAGQ